jgi:hypothetical protein
MTIPPRRVTVGHINKLGSTARRRSPTFEGKITMAGESDGGGVDVGEVDNAGM